MSAMKIPIEELYCGGAFYVYDAFDRVLIAFNTEEMAYEYIEEHPGDDLGVGHVFVYTTIPPETLLPKIVEELCQAPNCMKNVYGQHSFNAGCPGWPRVNVESKSISQDQSPSVDPEKTLSEHQE
jgi:hypothetical protein